MLPIRKNIFDLKLRTRSASTWNYRNEFRSFLDRPWVLQGFVTKRPARLATNRNIFNQPKLMWYFPEKPRPVRVVKILVSRRLAASTTKQLVYCCPAQAVLSMSRNTPLHVFAQGINWRRSPKRGLARTRLFTAASHVVDDRGAARLIRHYGCKAVHEHREGTGVVHLCSPCCRILWQLTRRDSPRPPPCRRDHGKAGRICMCRPLMWHEAGERGMRSAQTVILWARMKQAVSIVPAAWRVD